MDIVLILLFYVYVQASTGQVAKYKDHSNIYFYKPGYLVEIRYRPIHIYTDLAPNSKDYNTPLSKMRRSFGFGHLYEDYSYITSITYQPTGDNPVVPKGSYGPYGLPTVATIVLRPESAFETISYSEEKITLQTTLARIGGFLSLIGALIAFFFGMSAISPWGVITLIPCLRQEVSNSFISSNGYRPFTTPLENVKESGSTTEPQTEDVETRYLKERLNQLEQVLSQYYLDGKVFLQERTTEAGNDQSGDTVASGGSPVSENITLTTISETMTTSETATEHGCSSSRKETTSVFRGKQRAEAHC